MPKKIVLAYSGGLDTSVILKWLQLTYKSEVVTFTADLIDEKLLKIRLFSLRSFGESFYHSITDSSLEFGYKAI